MLPQWSLVMPQLNGRVMESRVALRQGPTMAEAAAAPLAQLTEGAEREKKGRPSNFPKISSSPSLQARAAAAAAEEEKKIWNLQQHQRRQQQQQQPSENGSGGRLLPIWTLSERRLGAKKVSQLLPLLLHNAAAAPEKVGKKCTVSCTVAQLQQLHTALRCQNTRLCFPPTILTELHL